MIRHSACVSLMMLVLHMISDGMFVRTDSFVSVQFRELLTSMCRFVVLVSFN